MATGLMLASKIAAITDDDGTGTTGTIFDKAWMQALDAGNDINSSVFTVDSSGDVSMVAAQRLRFDGVAGTGDTSVREAVANVLIIEAGGVDIASFFSTALSVAGVYSSSVAATHTFGPTSGQSQVHVIGASSGAGLGAHFEVLNGAVQVVRIGNESSITGGAYSALAMMAAAGDLAFAPGGTTVRFRMSSSGLNMNSLFKLRLDGSSGAGDTYIEENSANVLRCVSGGSGGVDLTSGATSWAAVSDERLKTDLEPISGALAKLGALRAVTGRYKTDQEWRSRSFLIAQDVQPVFPQAVTQDTRGILGLKYDKMIPLLVAGINELSARVAQLEAA